MNSRVTCSDPESFARGGPTVTTFIYEGREDSSTTISRAIIGPPTKRHTFRWRADDDPILNAGLVAL